MKRTKKIIFSLVFACFRFTEISYFLNFPSNENVRKQHLSASSHSCVSILSNKAKYLHKIFCQIKQNYTKNELYSTVKHIWVVCKDLWLLNFIFIASLYHSLVFNLLVSNNCSICVKAALKKIQQLSSLFYLMFWILVKQLKICKYTSKIVYSR